MDEKLVHDKEAERRARIYKAEWEAELWAEYDWLEEQSASYDTLMAKKNELHELRAKDWTEFLYRVERI